MTPRSRDHAALGPAAREARERTGLAQEALAGASGITPTYFTDIERGVRTPSYNLLLALARGLNTPLPLIMERGRQVIAFGVEARMRTLPT